MVCLGCAAENDVHKRLVEDSGQGEGIHSGVVLLGQLGEGVHFGLKFWGLVAGRETAVGQSLFNDDT